VIPPSRDCFLPGRNFLNIPLHFPKDNFAWKCISENLQLLEQRLVRVVDNISITKDRLTRENNLFNERFHDMAGFRNKPKDLGKVLLMFSFNKELLAM
jgi:hypothetical protein